MTPAPKVPDNVSGPVAPGALPSASPGGVPVGASDCDAPSFPVEGGQGRTGEELRADLRAYGTALLFGIVVAALLYAAGVR